MDNKEWEDKIEKINPSDKICINCDYLIWGVALGQGLVCSNDKNLVEGKKLIVSSRLHSCEYFRTKYNAE